MNAVKKVDNDCILLPKNLNNKKCKQNNDLLQKYQPLIKLLKKLL